MGKSDAVPRINPTVVRYACTHLAGPGESPYYIREAGGRDSLRGLMLRVHHRDVWFGVRWARGREWHKVQLARLDMTPDEVEEARLACRQVVRELEDEAGRPDLRARRMTLAELSEAYLADWETTRGERRSSRTQQSYTNLWLLHLLPVVLPGSTRPLGEYQMREITPDLVARLRDLLPRLAVERRPRASQSGTIATNRALQQGEAAFNMAVARGWCVVNPFSERLVRRHPEERDPHVLAEEDYAAVGRALRELTKACELPRPPLPYRSIAGLWLLILTGARPSEVTDAVLSKALQRHPLDSYCLLDERYPRLRVPRAKGDRGGMKREPGRWIWLPPTAVAIIHSVPRPAGCRWILPGDLADEPIQRLNKAWALVCREAKLKGVPLKTLRHSYRTAAAEAGIMREHVQQLLGHAGASITDAVYLHEIAPTLAAAATKVAKHLERATGGPSQEPLHEPLMEERDPRYPGHQLALREGLGSSTPGPARESHSLPTALELARFRELETTRETLGRRYDHLVQAKALLLCGLPYRSTGQRAVVRQARLGRRSYVSVLFSALDPRQPLPFGADRALLGWIQTLALQGGPTVRFDRLSDFFRAFGLASSGREYRIFRERLSRLCSLSITVRLSAEDGDRQLSMIPIKKSFTPGAGDEARTVLRSEASQLLLVPRSYGLELDPDFYQYLCEHPVPLPMPIMRLFHNSPKAWDFAQIVLYRSYATSTACVMTWPELLDQMSSEDTALSRLKATLRQVLREIQTVYPGFPARFLPARQGLRIEPWRPPAASSRS